MDDVHNIVLKVIIRNTRLRRYGIIFNESLTISILYREAKEMLLKLKGISS